MKKLKNIIPFLTICIPTVSVAGNLTCETYGFTAHSPIVSYATSYTSNTGARNLDLGAMYIANTYTPSTSASADISNLTDVKIELDLRTWACLGRGNQGKCDPDPGTYKSQGTVTVPPKTTINVPLSLSNGWKSEWGLVALPGSKVINTVTTSNGGSIHSKLNLVTSHSTTSDMLYQNYLDLTPNYMKNDTLVLPDRVYDESLQTGVNVNPLFNLENTTNIAYRLKVKSTSGDDTFVRVGSDVYSSGESTTQIYNTTVAIGLELAEGATPGYKSAIIEALWTCP